MIDGSWALEYAAILMLDSPDRPLPLRAVISSGEKVASALLCDLDRATLNHRFSQSMEIRGCCRIIGSTDDPLRLTH
jgi:hypothetical protein